MTASISSSNMPPLHSVSSSMLFGITCFGNQGGIGRKILAEFGYGLTVVVATVETAAAVVFWGASELNPQSSRPCQNAKAWLESSSFSIAWAATDCVLNLYRFKLIADEKSARQMIQMMREGDLMRYPSDAIV